MVEVVDSFEDKNFVKVDPEIDLKIDPEVASEVDLEVDF